MWRGTASKGQARRPKPDVVLLDLNMPGVSGRDAVRLIVGRRSRVPGAHAHRLGRREDLVETLRAGASGYLLKNIETEALVDAIRRANAGESVISPQMTAKLVQGCEAIPARIPLPEHDKLSPGAGNSRLFVAG